MITVLFNRFFNKKIYSSTKLIFQKMYRGGPEYCDGQLVIPQEGNLGSVWISGFDFACNLQKLK